MRYLLKKRKEFTKLYITGKYTQKQIAAQIGVTEKTACKWVKEMPEVALCKSKQALSKELKRLTAEKQCSRNDALISSTVTNIEKLDRLIKKSVSNGDDTIFM